MSDISITRSLWYEAGDQRQTLSQADLPDQTRPLVILGEPGMGKTHLLEWLAQAPRHVLCTARKLINRHDPSTLLGDARVLVIDALDEVSTRQEGEAVDLVLQRLGKLGYPCFVLACRAADWRSATGMEAIREQYEDGNDPLELHLEPFSDDDAISFLDDRLGVGSARTIVDHFHSRGLAGFLGNPQTLELVADVSGKGLLPENRAELFAQAVDVLRIETRDAKAQTQLASEAALDAAGAAFAALILTGNEAIVRTAEANTAEGEIPIAEIRRLPGAEPIDQVIGTRLFKAGGAARFGYWHRRIGEYLGARWLAKLADTDRKRRRMLALFQGPGLVPASLRGMHAWLAQDPALAAQVFDGDPMGVVEYGDADSLTVEQGRHFLQALQRLALRNPEFRDWSLHSLKGVVQPALVDDVHALLADPGTPFSLQMLILEALQNAPIAAALESELRTLFLDPVVAFAARRRAASALAGLEHAQDWEMLLGQLHESGDELTLRLAIEVMNEIGYEYVTDQLAANLIVSFAMRESRTIGVLAGMENHLPDSRIDDFLDRYVEVIRAADMPYGHQCQRDLADFAYHFVVRRLGMESIDPLKLWYWIQPFESDTGIDRTTRERLAQLIQDNGALRLGVLRHVLLERTDGGSPYARYCSLTDRSSGFAVTPDDVIELLGRLDPSDVKDERWRDIVRLTQHDHEHGAEVRAAARRFAAGKPEDIAWIDALAEPRIHEWHIKQKQRQQAHRELLARQHAEQRQEFTSRLNAVRRGEFASIVDLAIGYLGMYDDIGANAVPAHERVQQWLGPEIDAAARAGYEAFLKAEPFHPTPDEIAESLAKRTRLNGGYIVVAALAERYRMGTGFGDLDDERLLSGLFFLRQTKADDTAGIRGLEEAVEVTVYDRALWLSAMRRYLEPQLQRRRAYIDGLCGPMHDQTFAGAASDLAAEWLLRFPDLPAEPEAELVDRLVRSERFDHLRLIYKGRLGLGDYVRRRNWTAIGILADFDASATQLAASPVEPELIWHVRDRTSGGYRNHQVKLSAAQLEWIITSFRLSWPMTDYPRGLRTGDRNPWDASEYLMSLIRRLGTEADDAATSALHRLAAAAPDGYTSTILVVAAEQHRLGVESRYRPPTLAALEALVLDRPPASMRDLQAHMLEELAVVQAKITSDDAESWRGFFDDAGVPHDEERCRDHLLGLLRQGSSKVTFEPEVHVASDKEVDIGCVTGRFRLPVEIKGQWHAQLWKAADTQLDRLYGRDWQADSCGIYLVLWFGDKVPPHKRLKGPGHGMPVPTSPGALRDMLAAASKAVREGRVTIVVLDLTRN